jgi:hypothetical protein
MKLEKILLDPINTLTYIERFVNDGSPSGYSVINSTSEQTSPFNLNPWFTPYICISSQKNFTTYGKIPDIDIFDISPSKDWILVHPDMCDNSFFNNSEFELLRCEGLKVSPTSSGRTIQIINQKDRDYVKLHYDGTLGRVHRGLPFKKAISGPELSKYIIQNIDNNNIDKRISLFPECGAKIITNNTLKENNEWGMTWRSSLPYCSENNEIIFLLPVYSLFSYDRLASYEPKLLEQIINQSKTNPKEYILEKIVYQIIDCYFELIIKIGIQPEWNAQNLLIGFNKELEPIRFVMRDIESIDKDLTMMTLLGISQSFDSYPHKCIFEGQYNYQIKHSFMFDYKLGDYIIEPILIFLHELVGTDIDSLRKDVRNYTSKYIRQLPEDFFPKNEWYVFKRVLVDQSRKTRPYKALPNPKFR